MRTNTHISYFYILKQESRKN